jgi:hypothetical protein
MEAIKQIEKEIDSYLNGEVQISEGYSFSQYKLVKRITLFDNQIYPTGKTDSQGNYKYYFDIITPRKNAEVKNIDFDTKDIMLYSDADDDFLAIFIANAALKEWLRDQGQAEELNDAIEEAAGWGNVVWKKVKGGYERWDAKNFYVLNQTAKDLTKTAVIERHEMTQADLREKSEVWKNVDEVIKHCGNKFFGATEQSSEFEQETPSYEVYERNGEISERALFDAQGKENEGDPDKFVLAKIVVAGLDKNASEGKFVLYADTITKMPYKEYHRGPYTGRWWRRGLIEILFDCQVRANEIGNQIARGLEWASKTFFETEDQLIAQNILTDLVSGDIIKTKGLKQIQVRMEGFDQLLADWQRLMAVADALSNSFEVVSGEGMAPGTPFRMGALMNQNANKLFDYLREKLALAFQNLLQDWIVGDLMVHLKNKDILRLTGNSDYITRFREMAIEAWYNQNLLSLPPHGPDEAASLKEAKLEEMSKHPEELVRLEREYFIGVEPRVQVVISGEQTRMQAELESLRNFITLEPDPIRRSAMIEKAMLKSGLDVGDLPKSDPQMMQPQPQQAPQPSTEAPVPA